MSTVVCAPGEVSAVKQFTFIARTSDIIQGNQRCITLSKMCSGENKGEEEENRGRESGKRIGWSDGVEGEKVEKRRKRKANLVLNETRGRKAF